MPRPIVVLMNWIYMSATDMASFAHNVAAKSSRPAKAAATTAVPVPQADMDAAANRLELAFANRMNGAEAKTEFENADRDLDDLLHQQAAYVNGVANGDKAIIESYGFEATTNSRNKPVVPAAPNVPRMRGNAAELHLIMDAVPGATSYCWIIFTGEATAAAIADTHIALSGPAIVIPDGTAREILRHVIPAGTKITVQVLAQNSAGKSGFSAPVSITVGGS